MVLSTLSTTLDHEYGSSTSARRQRLRPEPARGRKQLRCRGRSLRTGRTPNLRWSVPAHGECEDAGPKPGCQRACTILCQNGSQVFHSNSGMMDDLSKAIAGFYVTLFQHMPISTKNFLKVNYCICHNFRVQIFSRFWTRCGKSQGLNFTIFLMFSLL